MSESYPNSIRPIDGKFTADVQQNLLDGQAPDAVWHQLAYRRVLRIGDFTGAAALQQGIDLFADLTVAARGRPGQSGDFLTDSWVNTLGGPYLRLITPFSGGAVATCTAEFGDVGDPDGFLTVSNVFTGAPLGIVRTPSAAKFDPHEERNLQPTLTLRTTVGDVVDLTDGALEVVIPYCSYLRDIS